MRATITQYVPGHSPLHRLDPRIKVVAVTTLAVALFVRDGYAALAVFGATALAAVLFSGVPARWFWRGLKPLLWLVGL
ncbi:MAG: energy-coupling factor transporter transmembrane protein EcfT, partial [Thermoleophilia bacterium]|nr:energy-coupling factor transporter transmembrane protein EcfT [Thermoleophilia bacterium]